MAEDGTISLDLNKAGSYLTGTTNVFDTALSRAAYGYQSAGDGSDDSTGLNLTLGREPFGT